MNTGMAHSRAIENGENVGRCHIKFLLLTDFAFTEQSSLKLNGIRFSYVSFCEDYEVYNLLLLNNVPCIHLVFKGRLKEREGELGKIYGIADWLTEVNGVLMYI